MAHYHPYVPYKGTVFALLFQFTIWFACLHVFCSSIPIQDLVCLLLDGELFLQLGFCRSRVHHLHHLQPYHQNPVGGLGVADHGRRLRGQCLLHRAAVGAHPTLDGGEPAAASRRRGVAEHAGRPAVAHQRSEVGPVVVWCRQRRRHRSFVF